MSFKDELQKRYETISIQEQKIDIELTKIKDKLQAILDEKEHICALLNMYQNINDIASYEEPKKEDIRIVPLNSVSMQVKLVSKEREEELNKKTDELLRDIISNQ
jgi:hypothetical protein